MKILAIGPGESTQWLFKQEKLNIPKDIVLLGMHRVFPHIDTISLDYWTWGDPDAAVEGLEIYNTTQDLNTLPNIVIPSYFKDITTFNKNAGTSPINRGREENISFYNKTISKIKNKITFIPNSLSTRTLQKDHKVFTHPKERFNRQRNYFGTVPFDGRHSQSKWAKENKFTSLILPIAYYLGATQVYCIGFDNRGTGIKRTIPQSYNNEQIIREYLCKYPKWIEEWKDYHNMNIYSITPDRFTPNNTVMKYKSIEDLGWIK